MFCQENSLSTAKHPDDHTSPCPLELCFYLFLRSCSEKPVLCKVQPPRYVHAHTSSMQCPHTQPVLFIYPSAHPSILLSLAPLICCPVIISQASKARQRLLSQSTILHFTITNTILRPPALNESLYIFTPCRCNRPPTCTPTHQLGHTFAFNSRTLMRQDLHV